MLIIGCNHIVMGRLVVAFPRGSDMEVVHMQSALMQNFGFITKMHR